MACATCHIPERYFTDGRPLPIVATNASLSESPTRHTPTVVGAALHRWQFWDGRADSLWAQALGPLENPLEHNSDRLAIVRYVLNEYRLSYLQAFPNSDNTLPKLERLPEHASPLSPVPKYQTNWRQLSSKQRSEINHVFANIGKALAAYQAKLLPDDSRFDRFVDALNLQADNRPRSDLDQHEQAGLKLFISEQAGCIQCHNGPLFSNSDFQATLSSADIIPEREGRIAGIALAHADPFNCRGIYSDAPNSCGELDFAKVDGIELHAAFKVPGLRNVAKTAPYMHDGGFASLSEVLRYYNQAPMHGFNHNELQPMRLMPYQLKQLESFLVALNSELITEDYWLAPPTPPLLGDNS